jgi:hypothetical protein
LNALRKLFYYFVLIKIKTRITFILELFIGACILLWVVFYNKFPLITQDSGAYLNSAFNLFFPSDRPFFYAVFLRLTGVHYTLFIPVVFQALITSLAVQLFLKVFLKRYIVGVSLLLLAALSMLTPVTYFVGQISADFSVAAMVLFIYCLMFSNNKKVQFLSFTLSLALSIMHNSNVLVLMALLFVVVITLLWSKEYKRFQRVTLVTASAILVLCFSNLYHHGRFTFSKVGHVFLMGKMVESGVLENVLINECHKEHYALCKYKDSLPSFASEFIWDKASPFYKTGGWDHSRKEYKAIIVKSLTQFKYLKLHFFDALESTFKQLPLIGVDDVLNQFGANSNPSIILNSNKPLFHKTFNASRQQKGGLKHVFKPQLYSWTLLLSSVLLLFAIWRRRATHLVRGVLVICLLVLLNGVATSVLANVTSRLNARCIWLILACFIAMLIHFWVEKKSTKELQVPYKN